jgi:hypothetical protein
MSYARENYVCSKCGNKDCKLWRQYQTVASSVELLCVFCAQRDQNKYLDLARHGDQIGWLVPAVPSGDTYWGYSSVPQDGVEWWQNLPTYPIRPATEQEAAEIVEQVDRWSRAGGSYNFSSYNGVAQAAVSEFVANQRGLTLFEGKPQYLRMQDVELENKRKKRLRERGIRT